MAHGPDQQSRPQLEQDTLFTQWQEGVLLGAAWLVYADERDSTRFFELRRIGSHLELQSFLQGHLMGRLRDGTLQALGIQEGSDAGPIQIPQYYFSKTAQVDWEKDIVAAIGKTFHEVRVKWAREPPDPTRPVQPTRWIHQRELEALSELGPPTEPEGFIDPSEQGEWESPDETLPRNAKPPNNPEVERELQSTNEALPSQPAPEKHEEAHSPSKVRGRPSKTPEIESAIEILLERGVDLGNMPRGEAYKAVRACAAKELNSNIKLGFSNPVIHRSLFTRFGLLR
jgi:hypothetical protein